MEPTEPELEPTAAPSEVSLDERIPAILLESAKPLPFGGIKKALKLAGVPLKGKNKVGDDAIQVAIDAAVSDGKAFAHPHKSPEGKPSYWHRAHVTKAELALEKAKAIEAKIAEKAHAKAAKLEEKARAKAADADEAARAKAATVAETVHRKTAELGHKPVSEKQLGQPKSTAHTGEHEAFRKSVDDLVDAGKLHRHGDKYGKHAPVVTAWYEARPLKKPFEDALKAARKILASGKVSADELAECLKKALDEMPGAPAEGSTPDAESPRRDDTE